MFLSAYNYLHSYYQVETPALHDRRRGACVQDELAMGGRALPEKAKDRRVFTAIIDRLYVWWVGKDSSEGSLKFEPTRTGPGRGRLTKAAGELCVTCRPLSFRASCLVLNFDRPASPREPATPAPQPAYVYRSTPCTIGASGLRSVGNTLS